MHHVLALVSVCFFFCIVEYNVFPLFPLPPPILVMMYKGLLAGYTYDESLTQSLVIPGMEAPPPIPPKKRKRKPVCLIYI